MLRVFAFGLIIILSLIRSICTQHVWIESGITATVTPFLWMSARYQVCPIDVGQDKVNSLLATHEMDGGGIETRQKPELASGFLPSELRDQQENAGANRITASQGTAGQTTVTPRMPETIAIRYVSNGGSDKNDGLSWGTAKRTIYGALVSLPGAGTNTAGSGTVYVGTGSSANPTTGAGIWLMGSGDPNYASPPAGWLKCNGCNVNFIGIGNTAGSPNGHKPLAKVFGGSAADIYHPSLWLSNVYTLGFQNLSFSGNAGRGIVIGECSDHSRGNTCSTVGIDFENVNAFITPGASLGPCTDIVGFNYWIFMHDFGCTGNTGGAAGGATANNAAAVLIDGTSSNSNGLIYIDHANFDNGGIKVIPGSSGAGLSVTNTIEESGGSNCAPVVWFTAWPAQTNLTVNNVVQADCPNSVPTVENDGTNINYGEPVAINTGIQGPSVVLNPFAGSSTISPLRLQQYGVNANYLVGETDVARRIAGLVPARFANHATTNPARWSSNNGAITITSGVSDPFGGTGAASVTSSSGAGGQQIYMAAQLNVTPIAGDWLVEGVWVKGAWAPTASVYLVGNCPGSGYPTTSATYYNSGLQIGDGQWQYVWFANKFVGGTGNTNVCMTGNGISTSSQPTLYGPTMYYIPAATLSDNEVLEFASSMNSVDPRCQVGQICNVSGHPVVVSSYGTLSNCSSVASPAKCDSAPAGSFVLGVGSTSATVNTTAVTANSQILIIEDSSLGAKLGVFCNKAAGRTYMITDRAPGLSFTVSSSLTPTDHPACLSFQLLN